MRALWWLPAAVVVGLALGLIHGDGGAARMAAGNLSAPWLLIALVPGWFARSWWRGAVLGTAVTMVGLLGFYVAMTWILRDHLGFGSDVLGYLRFVVEANRLWFEAGLVSGPLCGALAGALGARLRTPWLGLVAGIVLVGEYPVVRLVERLPAIPLLGSGWAGDTRIAFVQAGVGAVVLVGAATLLGRRRA